MQGFEQMVALLKSAGGLASTGQNKHADFSATGSVPNAAAGLSLRSDKLSAAQVAAVQASWGYLTASDFPEKVRNSALCHHRCHRSAALHRPRVCATDAHRQCLRICCSFCSWPAVLDSDSLLSSCTRCMTLQTRERIVDLGVKIFLALFKTVPESLRLFPFADADGKPVMSELKKHGLKTFVAFSDVIDGLDNADKTAQIYEHLVRCAPHTCQPFSCAADACSR